MLGAPAGKAGRCAFLQQARKQAACILQVARAEVVAQVEWAARAVMRLADLPCLLDLAVQVATAGKAAMAVWCRWMQHLLQRRAALSCQQALRVSAEPVVLVGSMVHPASS